MISQVFGTRSIEPKDTKKSKMKKKKVEKQEDKNKGSRANNNNKELIERQVIDYR